MKEVMEQRIALGLYAGPSPEQYIQDRLKWVARRQPGFKTETLSDGRTIQITQQPLEDGGWLSIHEDVSERMRAEKALQQSEAQLRAVLDNSPFCVNLKGLEGRYVFANGGCWPSRCQDDRRFRRSQQLAITVRELGDSIRDS